MMEIPDGLIGLSQKGFMQKLQTIFQIQTWNPDVGEKIKGIQQ